MAECLEYLAAVQKIAGSNTTRAKNVLKLPTVHPAVNGSPFVVTLFVGKGYRRRKERIEHCLSSRKHLRTKVIQDFHLTYSKNGGNLGSESK